MKHIVTNSALKSARACLRMYQISYLLGVRPRETSLPLRFGLASHGALERRWRTLAGELDLAMPCEPDDPFEAAKLRALMAGYEARWDDDAERYEVLLVEAPFEMRLRVPSGHPSTKWHVAGKIDGAVRERQSNRGLVLEHKTTNEDIRVGSDYWTRLRMDAQVSIYYDGAAALGLQVSGVLYDVIGKPQLEPLKATPVEKRKFTKGKRCKSCKEQPVQCVTCFAVEPSRLHADQRERDETPEEYEARIVEAIAADPDRFYQRAEVVRLESEIDASRRDVWETSRLISLGYYPRNVDSCMRYGRACAYLPVCSGAGTLDDEARYQKLEDVHPELGDHR
jgi:hypothetical protein